MKHHDAVDRTHELRIAAPPAHQFRDRQRLQRFLNHPGEELIEHRAFHPYTGEHHCPFGRVASLELLGRKAVLARKAGDRLRRRVRRRAGDLALAACGARGHLGDRESQSPRRGIHRQRALRLCQRRLGQGIEHALGKGLGQRAQRFRRQLLREQLDEQRGFFSHGRAGSRGVRELRNRTAPPRAPGRAPARCTLRARSRRWRRAHRAG